MTTIRITGIGSLRRALRRMPEEVGREMREAIRVSADEVAEEMRGLVPVRSGEMRDAVEIRIPRDGMSARIGPGVRRKRTMRRVGWRARFIEWGTRQARAQPFVRRALERRERAISARLDGALDRVIRRIAAMATPPRD